MLQDELWAFLLCFFDVYKASQAECTGWIIDGYNALPLLNCQRLILWKAEADRLTLCIEGIEIDMGNYPERT